MSVTVTIERIAQNFGPIYPDVPVVDLSELGLNATARDAVGRLVFTDLTFTSKKLGKSFKLQTEPLVMLRRKKNLVKTVIAGNSRKPGGMVVEQVNHSYYTIDIVGYLINRDQTKPRYPQDQVIALREMADSGEALDVDCSLLKLFGINKMVIEDVTWPPGQGKPFSQDFRITGFEYQDFLVQRKLNKLL
jgi:hypothetical protein